MNKEYITFREFIKKLAEIIVNILEIDKEDFKKNTLLKKPESHTNIEIIRKLEDKFEITIPKKDEKKFITAKSCIQYIYGRLVSRIKKFRLTDSSKTITEYFNEEYKGEKK